MRKKTSKVKSAKITHNRQLSLTLQSHQNLGVQLQNQVNQGIIDLNRNGNSATFFSYVCNAKIVLTSYFILLKME